MSEPLLKRRKRMDVIETGVQSLPRDEPGGCLLIGQVVTGVTGGASSGQAPARNVGTCRPGGVGGVLEPPAKGSTPSSGNCKGPSTELGHRDGPARSSGDAR